MRYDCVVRGGRVVTASEVFEADVGIADGRVIALGHRLPPGDREIDATGRLVLPGGVDSHAHIAQDFGDALNADTFESATASAAVGGTTSVVCFAEQPKGGSLADAVTRYAAKAQASRIDYAFHLMVTDPRPEIVDRELPALVAAGNRSFKIFMAGPAGRVGDADALRVLAAARRLGAIVCVHAENQDLLQFHVEALVAAGLTRPLHHAWSRPMVVEREATHRAIAIAEALDVPIQVFHVTGAESAEEIARARARELKVFAETCPQYLLLTANDLDRPGFEGAKLLCGPALRSADDQEALWRALRAGTIDNVSSDHAPQSFEGPHGKRVAGDDAPFPRVPKGMPGIGSRLPLMFSEGVRKGRIDLNTFVAVTSTNAAKIFGLWPRKGTIAIGSDADLVVWDLGRVQPLTNAMLRHGCDYTPFEGWTLEGWPLLTLLRGEIAARDGEPIGKPGGGRFLARGPYDAIKPRGTLPTPFDPVLRQVRPQPEKA